MGGGENHRMNLSEGAIIKDNHIAATGSITEAVKRVRAQFAGMPIEVEVDNLEQLREALKSNVEVILLDNMDLEMTKQAVEIAKGSNSKLESSGGLTLDTARAYAQTGVDFLAVGALTHSAPILDIGLDF
jgi:nicotinate-nucleotide pyrophosphorylase (carboxylating)